MKKIFAILVISALFFASNVSAQSDILGKLFGNNTKTTESSTTNTISNVLGSLIGNSLPVSDELLIGTWNYTSVACVLSSDEALANIGGTLGSSKIEETLNGYLAKVGVKEGSCSFVFDSENKCIFKVAGREVNGTYTFNAEDKKMELVFYNKLRMTADVAYNLSTLNIVFNADKLLSLIKTVTSKVAGTGTSGKSSAFSSLTGGTSSSTLSTVSSLLEKYDGMMLGMKLKK